MKSEENGVEFINDHEIEGDDTLENVMAKDIEPNDEKNIFKGNDMKHKAKPKNMEPLNINAMNVIMKTKMINYEPINIEPNDMKMKHQDIDLRN